MAPMTNRVKVERCFQGLTIETNNFAFGLSDDMLLESTIPDGRTGRVGSDGAYMIIIPTQPSWSWGLG